MFVPMRAADLADELQEETRAASAKRALRELAAQLRLAAKTVTDETWGTVYGASAHLHTQVLQAVCEAPAGCSQQYRQKLRLLCLSLSGFLKDELLCAEAQDKGDGNTASHYGNKACSYRFRASLCDKLCILAGAS